MKKPSLKKFTLYDLYDYVGESGGSHGLHDVSAGIVTLQLIEVQPSIKAPLPYCEIHGAMIKVSDDGIWRCCDPIHHGCYYDNSLK